VPVLPRHRFTCHELGNRREVLVDADRQQGEAISGQILRVSASLDLEAVLREIVDGARALTGARYGLIMTVDDAGEPQDFVTAGVAPGVHAEMLAWPDGPRLFAHFRNLSESLRVADLPAYVRRLGFPTELIAAAQQAMTREWWRR